MTQSFNPDRAQDAHRWSSGVSFKSLISKVLRATKGETGASNKPDLFVRGHRIEQYYPGMKETHVGQAFQPDVRLESLTYLLAAVILSLGIRGKGTADETEQRFCDPRCSRSCSDGKKRLAYPISAGLRVAPGRAGIGTGLPCKDPVPIARSGLVKETRHGQAVRNFLGIPRRSARKPAATRASDLAETAKPADRSSDHPALDQVQSDAHFAGLRRTGLRRRYAIAATSVLPSTMVRA